ncbi:MAG: glycosyltransferase family 2 protein [Anaerolineae bacterium]|nr:glycosyltransferase family 2 protein [Anaerolineae bacterium]
MSDQPTCSVVVPVYNSEATLTPLIERLAAVLPILTSQYEVILVNDGSRDNSWEVVSRLTETYSWVHGINFMRNYGQHNALLAGIRAASHEIIITMDDDLQHPPEEIPKLLAKLAEGYDVVYGTPQEYPHGIWRTMASRITKLALQGAMGAETAKHISAFRAFRTQIRDALTNFQGPYVSIDVLLTWGTTRFAAATVRHEERAVGKSNYTFRKLIRHTMNMMTGFSAIPLQLASLVGFVFTVFGILLLLFVVGRYLIEGESVPGFPFLASTIAIFSGAQLFALGIIGEYLARMHFRMMDRPTYTIRSKTWE